MLGVHVEMIYHLICIQFFAMNLSENSNFQGNKTSSSSPGGSKPGVRPQAPRVSEVLSL